MWAWEDSGSFFCNVLCQLAPPSDLPRGCLEQDHPFPRPGATPPWGVQGPCWEQPVASLVSGDLRAALSPLPPNPELLWTPQEASACGVGQGVSRESGRWAAWRLQKDPRLGLPLTRSLGLSTQWVAMTVRGGRAAGPRRGTQPRPVTHGARSPAEAWEGQGSVSVALGTARPSSARAQPALVERSVHTGTTCPVTVPSSQVRAARPHASFNS